MDTTLISRSQCCCPLNFLSVGAHTLNCDLAERRTRSTSLSGAALKFLRLLSPLISVRHLVVEIYTLLYVCYFFIVIPNVNLKTVGCFVFFQFNKYNKTKSSIILAVTKKTSFSLLEEKQNFTKTFCGMR